ncbi:MAG: hypothetical protein E7012_02605 [Alphaproteobacteria bacterium]|nr:hypothetical protein [Alphaproteobacteria bacterium]
MSDYRLHNHINKLHQQINYSVEKLKHRSLSSFESSSEEHLHQKFPYQVEGHLHHLLSGEINWSLQTHNYSTENSFQYVSSSYSYADNILKEPTVLIDFMFPNNQEFDFKV